MSEFEKCSICGKGNLLPMSYMRCDTCDSELAGARELRINKRLVHDADTISLKNEIERLTQQLEEAKRDAAIMAKAFRKYARHEYECMYRLGEPDPCGMLQMMHKAHDITAIKE